MTTLTLATRHAETAAGLRDLAEFIEQHPDLPLAPGDSPWRVFVLDGSDSERCAEVDRIAAILGVQALVCDAGGAYEAVRRFGPVAYSASAVFEEERDRYRHHMAPYHAETARRIAAAVQDGKAA